MGRYGVCKTVCICDVADISYSDRVFITLSYKNITWALFLWWPRKTFCIVETSSMKSYHEKSMNYFFLDDVRHVDAVLYCSKEIVFSTFKACSNAITYCVHFSLSFHFTPTSTYRKTSNINHTLVSNKIVDNSDVVGACRCVSNYIFILNLTHGFNGLSEDICKRIQETFKFWGLVRLILEVLR